MYESSSKREMSFNSTVLLASAALEANMPVHDDVLCAIVRRAHREILRRHPELLLEAAEAAQQEAKRAWKAMQN